MIVINGALTLLLTLQEAAPTDTATRSPCELTDNACKAKLFIQKSTKAPPLRRPAPDLRPEEHALAASHRPVQTAQPEGPATPGRTSMPGRPMIIAGGTTLGLGLVLTGVAGYAGSRVAEASRASFDLYDQNQGQGDAEALAEQTQLRNTFHRWDPVTIGTTIAGSAAVIVGAVLVRIGVRRMQPSRTAVVPVPGGLAIHARF